MSKKTDNDNLPAKLALRRSFLAQHQAMASPLRVLDCFSGAETIWTPLRRSFPIESYLALDKKKKTGRLAMDSFTYLRAVGPGAHTVVDLDAYGAPWEHWFSLLAAMPQSPARVLSIFLTVGNVALKVQAGAALEALGITFDLPPALHCTIAEQTPEFLLRVPSPAGWWMDRLAEAPRGRTARYFGVRFCRK